MDSPSPNAIDFSQRAELEEQIDGPCSYEELRDCLRDLAAVNRLVLAHRPIFQWLERVAAMHPEVRPLRIVDVGSGYGDMLRRIETWAAKRGIAVELTGVDINAHALRSARESTPPSSRIRWILCDVTTCAELGEVDLITTCGVMHHLTEPHIVDFLRWSEETARIGYFFCDLHRKPAPYRLFGLMTRVGRWHRFIRPDGLTSIRRSFLAEDWQRMCAAAGLDASAVTIAEYKPARLCVERTRAVARAKPLSSLAA